MPPRGPPPRIPSRLSTAASAAAAASLEASSPRAPLSLSRAYLHDWMQQLNSRSPKFENCPAILQGLPRTLCLAKVKNSAKGKVLFRAFYAVNVETIFVCSIIVAALSGCSKPLIDLHVSASFLWSEVFNDLQADVNEKITGMLSCEKVVLLKELAVDTCAKKLYVLSSSVDDLEDWKKLLARKKEKDGRNLFQISEQPSFIYLFIYLFYEKKD